MTLRALTVIALSVALVGCTEDVPITTEPGLMHDELHQTMRWGAWSETVLLVLEPSERAASTEAALAFIREMVTGDSDGDGVADHYAQPSLRVAVVTPEWVDGFFSNDCDAPAACAVTPAVAAYEWLPYGFAPASPAAFLDHVRCLLSATPADCSGSDDATLVPSFLSVTAEDLATKTFAEFFDFSGAADFGPWSPPIDRVMVDDDGRVQCSLKETLPASGPITRCDQLVDFGRSFDRVDADGRDVCEIQQLAPDLGDATPVGYGFYYYEGNDQPPVLSLLPIASPYPEFGLGCNCGVFYGYGHPYLLMTLDTPFIPDTTIDLRCALDPGEPAL